jgi:hypothetical protein
MKMLRCAKILALCSLLLMGAARSPSGLEQPGKFWTEGQMLYVVNGSEVYIYSIVDPAAPLHEGIIDAPGSVGDIAVYQSIVYLDVQGDMLIYDAIDPDMPVLLRSIEDIFNYRWDYNDDYEGYGGCGGCMYDYANSDTPRPAAASSMSAFAVHDQRLYAAGYNYVSVFDLSDPSNPGLLGDFEISGRLLNMYRNSSTLFVASSWGVYAYDLSGTDIPQARGIIPHSYISAKSAALAGNGEYLYMTVREGRYNDHFALSRLMVLRINDLTDMELLSMHQLDTPRGLDVLGSLLYVCDGAWGLRILDLSNPALPQRIHRVEGYNAYDVMIREGLLFLSDTNGMYIFDMSDAAAPVLLTRL